MSNNEEFNESSSEINLNDKNVTLKENNKQLSLTSVKSRENYISSYLNDLREKLYSSELKDLIRVLLVIFDIVKIFFQFYFAIYLYNSENNYSKTAHVLCDKKIITLIRVIYWILFLSGISNVYYYISLIIRKDKFVSTLEGKRNLFVCLFSFLYCVGVIILLCFNYVNPITEQTCGKKIVYQIQNFIFFNLLWLGIHLCVSLTLLHFGYIRTSTSY